jgi:hypothetical protein
VTPAWPPWSDGDKECLEKVQKRAVRMVSRLAPGSYMDRLKELGLLTLDERRHRLDMIQAYKFLREVDKIKKGILVFMASKRKTRQAADPWNIKSQTARFDVRKNLIQTVLR